MANIIKNYQVITDPESKITLSPEKGSLFHACHKSSLVHNEVGTRPRSNISIEAKNMLLKDNHYQDSSPYARSKHHGKNYYNLEITDQALAHQEADNHSNKVFKLKSFDSTIIPWILPPPDQLYMNPIWKDSELQAMKDDLNKVKGQLEWYDIEIWHQHTHDVNPAVSIPNIFRGKAKPEFLTQAFLKFYEILHKFPLVPETLPQDSTFRTLHLCEAPGAFVVALNHFLGANYPSVRKKWHWLGNTLNPYFEGTPTSECISDDRFILHSLKNWYFGKDQTGNLMSISYLNELEELHKSFGTMARLVTADGSIDCQGNPAEQETMTHHLHFCEVYAGISLLATGGSLVLKKFTFFEAESVNLLYFLCCAFEEVTVYKPITSKLGNSEVYIVCLNYNSCDSVKEYLKVLRTFYEINFSTTMFSKEQIPASFLSHIKTCSNFFKDYQVNAIQRNIDLYETSCQKKWAYKYLLKKLVVQRFFLNNNCDPLPLSERLVQDKKLEWDRHVYPHSTLKWGEQIMKKSKLERIEFLNSQLEYLITKHSDKCLEMGTIYNQFVIQETEHCPDLELLKFDFQFGKPFDLVYISRFCHASVLQVYIHYIRESSLNLEYKSTNQTLIDSKSLEMFKENKNIQLTEIIKSQDLYPNSVILNEGNYAGPHSKCHAFDILISLIMESKVQTQDDVILLNVALLTRLQYGLFLALTSLFSAVKFYYSEKASLLPPFIVLSRFRSSQQGILLCGKLKAAGWCKDSSNKGIHEIMSILSLIKSPIYPFVCNYNANSCLWNINLLKETQTDAIMKSEPS